MNRHTPILKAPHHAVPYRQIKFPAAVDELSEGLWVKFAPNRPLTTRQNKEIFGAWSIDTQGGRHG